MISTYRVVCLPRRFFPSPPTAILSPPQSALIIDDLPTADCPARQKNLPLTISRTTCIPVPSAAHTGTTSATAPYSVLTLATSSSLPSRSHLLTQTIASSCC